MCTAATYQTKDFYMGRTLDYEFSYGEQITITPRQFPIRFRYAGINASHYAIIGMAHVAQQYPLYYDAVNEKGLGMAGLNFVGNARYRAREEGKVNVAQYEFVLWILGQCATVQEARQRIEAMNLTGDTFCEELPASMLHWLIADRTGAITVEAVEEGIRIYDNPVGVLTNNPPFPQQMFLLNQYMHVSPAQPQNTFARELPLQLYSRGMGAMGLPGDWSSTSRFARTAFVRANAKAGTEEADSVGQFFHILGTVDQPRGCCEVEPGKYEITIYTSCWNATKGIYYYTTYTNHQITAVDMHREALDSADLICYPMRSQEQICLQNS